MIENIVETVIAKKAERIRVSPCHTNRASQCGHSCARYLVYCRTAWQEKKLHSAETEFIFEAGRRIEDEAIDELKQAGFQVIQQQRDFHWPEFNISGSIDGFIVHEGKKYPLEIKSMNQFDWEKLSCIEDFLGSKKVWIKKYPAQLALYILMANQSGKKEMDLGLFYIKNKQSHLPKAIWMHLDYTFAEDILKKIEIVNKHVENKTLPDPMNWDEFTCGRCEFLHICTPDRQFSEMEILTDPEFESSLQERQELKEKVSPMNSRLKEIDNGIKPKIKGKNLIVGDFRIIGKEVERKGYTVEDKKYWDSKIIYLPNEKKKKKK